MHEHAILTPETSLDFQGQLAAIINTPLTAETIDTYAESALDNLANLTQCIADSYPVSSSATDKELEDAAYAYFGLERLDNTLEHIADKAEEIQALNAIIATANTTDEVITPPDVAAEIVPNGNGYGPEEQRTVPRLKTLLFILANEFSIDINDSNQIQITKGAVDSNMRRQESYYLVETPAINRKVLVCDEVRNATFVFDGEVLKENHVSSEQLAQLTKDELNVLLRNHPEAGQRVILSSRFVPNIIAALSEPLDVSSTGVGEENAGRYLQTTPQEGVLPLSRVAQELGVDRTVAEKAITELGEALGAIHLYTFTSRKVEGYTPEQQAAIRTYLKEIGYYDEPPEGSVSKAEITRTLGVEMVVLDRAIKQLGEELGDTASYRSKARRLPHYSVKQQEMIRERLEASGAFADKAPEDYETARAISKVFRVGRKAVVAAIGELGEDLGEVRSYKFHGGTHAGYSPEQQGVILSQLHFTGSLLDKAPENFKQTAELADQFGVSYNVVQKAINELGEDLGEAPSYRARRRSTPHYSPEQQKMIRAQLESSGQIGSDAPDDYLAAAGIAKILGVAHLTVTRAIGELREEVGEAHGYKFKSVIAPGYSPHQQEVVTQHLIEKLLKQ